MTDNWTKISKKNKQSGMSQEQIEEAKKILEMQAAKQKQTLTKIGSPIRSPFGIYENKIPRKKKIPQMGSKAIDKFHEKHKDNVKLWTNRKP